MVYWPPPGLTISVGASFTLYWPASRQVNMYRFRGHAVSWLYVWFTMLMWFATPSAFAYGRIVSEGRFTRPSHVYWGV